MLTWRQPRRGSRKPSSSCSRPSPRCRPPGMPPWPPQAPATAPWKMVCPFHLFLKPFPSSFGFLWPHYSFPLIHSLPHPSPLSTPSLTLAPLASPLHTPPHIPPPRPGDHLPLCLAPSPYHAVYSVCGGGCQVCLYGRLLMLRLAAQQLCLRMYIVFVCVLTACLSFHDSAMPCGSRSHARLQYAHNITFRISLSHNLQPKFRRMA